MPIATVISDRISSSRSPLFRKHPSLFHNPMPVNHNKKTLSSEHLLDPSPNPSSRQGMSMEIQNNTNISKA
jgi:hypothetical protein